MKKNESWAIYDDCSDYSQLIKIASLTEVFNCEEKEGVDQNDSHYNNQYDRR